jgi:hydrogenase maturation protein HypF
MNRSPAQQSDLQRLAVRVRGVVQGVGFRPFVYRVARQARLTGWVLNQSDTVLIEVQGEPQRLDDFVSALRREAPPQARIDSLEVQPIALDPASLDGFQIRASTGGRQPRPATPADLATCPECQAEIRTPGERRYQYPFTNCTNCGPRWSIIAGLPYDRPRTSMAGFPMCADCQAEYDDPADRRFHAQPVACPRCGPMLFLMDRSGVELARADAALTRTAAALADGKILALKGLGGFQLLVDATHAAAVRLLRERKRRPDKPLAIMAVDLSQAEQLCHVSADEAQALQSHQAPILLLRQRSDGLRIASEVAPGNPYLGVMLPYTPLHHLLLDAVGRPLVCTSGNLSEEPMAITLDDAVERLGPIADLILTHNRPIVRPVDDSVARIGPTGLEIFRRARGFAPLPIALEHDTPVILALGGHLKNTVGLALHGQAVLTPHVGDLEHLLSVEVHKQAAQDLVDFFQVVPEVIACDLHPDYASTRYAETLAARWNVPLVRVQHHHAHGAACMAEHRLPGPLLVLAWDGTGYGTDGTIWGGEALLCEGAEFRRAAHLRPFSLPGGEQAVRQPRRSALGVLYEIGEKPDCLLADSGWSPADLQRLETLLSRKLNCPRTTSMGRLFDAVAGLCRLQLTASFEGQAAMALEFAADRESTASYPLPLTDAEPAVANWEPLVRGVLADRQAGVPVSLISARFHNALAELAVAIARRMGVADVGLSGGCFQNLLLATRVRARLLDAGFQVYSHSQVPPGDGGIALGQILVAARRIEGDAHVPGHSG